jgi:hypothetical protein
VIYLTTELQKEKDQSMPKLNGEILLSSKIISHNKKDLGFLLSVSIWNSGADSAIRGYWTKVSFDDKVFELRPWVLPDKGLITCDKGGPKRVFTSDDALEKKTLSPIKKGEIKTGILLFIIENGIRFKDIPPKWTLYFTDYLGKVYEIHTDIGQETDRDLAVPGATGSEPKPNQ